MIRTFSFYEYFTEVLFPYFSLFFVVVVLLLLFIFFKNFIIIIILFCLFIFFLNIILLFHVPGCSGMFRNVPACSGMFHVPGSIDGLL